MEAALCAGWWSTILSPLRLLVARGAERAVSASVDSQVVVVGCNAGPLLFVCASWWREWFGQKLSESAPAECVGETPANLISLVPYVIHAANEINHNYSKHIE